MRRMRCRCPGRAVQVDPMKPTLQPPGIDGLKLKIDKLLSSFAFNLKLRRYDLNSIAFIGSCIDFFILGRGLHSSTSQLNLSRF